MIATAVIATTLTLLLAAAVGGAPQLNANTFLFPLQLLLIFGAVACGGMILIGLPVTYFLSKLSAESEWTYALSGALAGAAIASIFIGGLFFGLGAAVGAAFGACAGLIWWHAYRKRVAARTSSSEDA